MIAVVCFRIGPVCLTNSLLELWSFDEAIINGLTKEDILNKVNQPSLIRYAVQFVFAVSNKNKWIKDHSGSEVKKMWFHRR